MCWWLHTFCEQPVRRLWVRV